MRSRLQHFRPIWLSRWLGLLLVATLLVSGVAASWEPLHEWLHHDAEGHDHECAITMMAAGAVDCGSTMPVLGAPALVIWVPQVQASRDCWVEGVFARAAIWEHAPPGGAVS